MTDNSKLIMELELGWVRDPYHPKKALRFSGDEREFEDWRTKWFKLVPKCQDFDCYHDSMTCGIHFACGDCSSYTYMVSHGCLSMCDTVNCGHCAKRGKCENGRATRDELEQLKPGTLKFIPRTDGDDE